MSKTVLKLRPHDYWRIGEHESWFTDMASKGLHLKKIGPYFARFEKGPSQKMKYRIEVSKGKTISDEQIDAYEEAGWQYITSFQRFHVFASPVELNAVELHTDPVEQAFTLDNLNQQLILNTIFTVIASLFSIGMTWAIWFLDGTPLLQLVKGGNLVLALLQLYLMSIAIATLRAAISINRLRRNLLEGKMINHQASWKKGKRLNPFLFFSFITIVFVGSIVNLIEVLNNEPHTLPEGEVNYPFVRLMDVEQNTSLIRDEYWRDGVDLGNSYSSSWSLVAPVQYEMSESGIVLGEMWEDSSEKYSPSIDMTIFQLRWAFLSKPLVDDLAKWYSYEGMLSFNQVQHDYFDKLVVQEEDGSKQIIACKGKIVMHIRYYGYSELDVLLENMIEKFESI